MKETIQAIIDKGQKNRPEQEHTLAFSIFQSFTPYLSWLLINARFTPNAVTVTSMIAAIVGGAFLSLDTHLGYLCGAFFMHAFIALDFCDGEVARYLEKKSMSGNYLDYLGHFVMFSCLLIGLSTGIYRHNSSLFVLLLGMLGITGIFMIGLSSMLIWEIICTEYLRTQKRIKNSNEKIDYKVEYEIKDDVEITVRKKRKGLLRKMIRWTILPSNGDSLVYFMTPVVLLNLMISPILIEGWAIGIMDVYFVYLCLTNFLLSIAMIARSIQKKQVETVYSEFFSNKIMSHTR
jgi:phosphatidylglycerophosphate synthase